MRPRGLMRHDLTGGHGHCAGSCFRNCDCCSTTALSRQLHSVGADYSRELESPIHAEPIHGLYRLSIDLNGPKSDLNSLASDLYSLESNLNSLESDLYSLESNLNSLRIELYSLECDRNNLESDLNTS